MKMPVSAVLKLSAMTPADKITKAAYMAQQWELNKKNFPATAPNSPAERAAAAARLSTAHAAALDGGKQARAEEKAALAEFDALFGAFRDWANQPEVAQDDEVRIGQLGFDVSRQEARRAGPVATPELLPLGGTTEGSLLVACTSQPDARAYIGFVAYGDNPPADDDYRYCAASTRPKFSIAVPSGRMAWVRVLAVGTHGPSPLSAPQKRRVL